MAHFDRLTLYNIILQDGLVPLFYSFPARESPRL
jgi:hypothetical protein